MTTLQVSKLKAVLDRAKHAGHCEESATICGIPLVFSSLPPSAYTDIIQELEDVPEVEYPLAYQIEHVCRSLVEIDGVDLRGVDSIEVPGDGAPVLVERHQWIKDDVMSDWSREMVIVAFKKVMDALDAAEEKAKAGVSFRIQNESDEDKFHRLLAELRDIGAELPPDLRGSILKEHGLLEATSKAELEALNADAKRWLQESRETLQNPDVEQESEPLPVPSERTAPRVTKAPVVRAPQQLVQALESEEETESDDTMDDVDPPDEYDGPLPGQPVAAAGPIPKPKTPRDMLQSRTPLNRQPIAPPVPQTAGPGQKPVLANPRGGRPPADQVAAMPQNSKAAQYAALEADAASGGVALSADLLDGQAFDIHGASPVLEQKTSTAVDKEGFRLNRPPVSGMNKKFVDPRRNMSGINPRNRDGR
jgi:hypothetical protein